MVKSIKNDLRYGLTIVIELQNGFQTVNSKWYDFYKKSGSGSCRIRMMSVTFEGVLKVTDAEKFKETLCCGIGREKAYGQGLITVVGARK